MAPPKNPVNTAAANVRLLRTQPISVCYIGWLDTGLAEAYKQTRMGYSRFLPCRPASLLWVGAVLAAPASAAPPRDLLSRIDVSLIQCDHARAYQDPRTKALTITFEHFDGEAAVRLPVKLLGWPTDWSGYRSLQYTFHATSSESVAIRFSNGAVERSFLTEPLAGIRIYGVIPFDSFVQNTTMTPLNPLGYKVWLDRLFPFDNVESISFRMRFPSTPAQFTLYSLELRSDVPEDDILDRKPLIDRYGQWIPENWPDKTHSDEQLRGQWDADTLPSAGLAHCPLGGDLTRQLRATGFFRTERQNRAWTFVDPHGHPFFSAGMDLVGYREGSFATDVGRREFLFEQLPPQGPAWLAPTHVSFYVSNVMRRYGDDWQQKWTQNAIARLKNWGFNTIANWSDYEVATKGGMPYVLPLSGWTTRKMFPFPWDFPDIFSKEFEDNVEQAAARQLRDLRDDPNLIGWFIGNEPHWARAFGSRTPWPEMLLADSEPSATQAHLRQLLRENPSEEGKIKADFLYICARRYFEVIAAAVRRHDPNHLLLGIRFAENPNDRWVELSRIFDVFSINIYSREFRPDPANIRRYAAISGRPVLIGEFTACAPGRGMQGLFYWTHKVRDHAERGRAYRYYVENAAADPNIVGTHWFQMVDDLPTGRPSDQERLNYGFINVLDLPYRDLTEAARETHARIYALKRGDVSPYRDKPRPN